MRNFFLILCCFVWGSVLHAETARQEITQLRKRKEALIFEQQQLLGETNNVQKKMTELFLTYRKKKEKLANHQTEISKALPLLARLERANPASMVIDPATGQYRGRGIILMRSLVSSVKRSMQQVQAALNDLEMMSTELGAKREVNGQLLRQLGQQRAQLALLEDKKIEDWTRAELERIGKDDDINSLLDESRATLSKVAREISVTTALKGLPFRRLERPVAGKLFKDATLQTKFSPHSQGIFFETRKNAHVVAPAKGRVVFKGPFRAQAEILIIDHGDQVQTILMGMHKINADVGKNVYAGEKLGTMAGYGAGAPRLYLELRHKGKSIDSAPYFAIKNLE